MPQSDPGPTDPGAVRRYGTAVRAWWADSPRRWSGPTLLNLVWLVVLVYSPIFDPTDRTWLLVVSVVTVAVFVPLYLAVELRDGPVRRWAPELTTALAVAVLAAGHAGGTVLTVYAAVFAAALRPRRHAVVWFAALTAAVLLAVVLSDIPLPWRTVAFAPPLVLIWVLGLLSLESADADRAAGLRAAQVEHLATVAERERISRDLHDVLGQTLTGIVVRAQLAARLTPTDPAAGVAEMAEVETAARTALTELRSTVAGFRRADLDAEVAAARSTLTSAGVDLRVHRDLAVVLNPRAESALAMALREAVTNVVRHAGARHCVVDLHRVDARVLLSVTDDGSGSSAREGAGLTGMRERIAALGGDVVRRTRPGTTVVVSLPEAVSR